MMIKVSNFNKKYGDRVIFNDVTIEFPTTGIISILGDSGSGKTTLLNAIAGVDLDYSGSVSIDGVRLEQLTEKELRNYRLKNIGYVFQNFNLLNLETAETNILVPLESSSNGKRKIIKRRIDDLLKRSKISKLRKNNVNKLSGGEKQRVAISRALANKPKVILCDEPTGALDEQNSAQIFNILRQISVNSLVIIATHDRENAFKFSDYIYEVSDKNIVLLNEQKFDPTKGEIIAIDSGPKLNQSSLPLAFKIKHAFHKNKSKKFRSLISNSILSLALVGVGLSILLTSSISESIQTAFSSLIDVNQIVMSMKNEDQNLVNGVYSAPLNKVKEIEQRYPYYISGVGVNYQVNFEEFFKDGNYFYIASSAYRVPLPKLSARNINDFVWLEENNDRLIYPYSVSSLGNDEIVLGLDYVDMVNLCFELKIQRSYAQLGNYIKTNGLRIALSVENKSWQYSDEQLFTIKGVCETNSMCLFHTNLLWNQHMFEDEMRFPTNDNNSGYYPWEMYKLYYVKTKIPVEEFLNYSMYDDFLYDFVLERTNSVFNPKLCFSDFVCDENRLYIYYVDKSSVDLSHLKILLENNPELKNYIVTSDFGYSSYASGIISGFSKNLFISLNSDLIDKVIDADTSNNDESGKVALPDGVLQGCCLGSDSNFKFSNKTDKLIYGRLPKNNNEIVVSKKLGELLGSNNFGLGEYLHLAGVVNEQYGSNGKIERTYNTAKIVIVGVTDVDKPYIYHNSDWSISFFRDKLGISSFNLIPRNVVFELDDNVNSDELVLKLNQMFQEYEFISPSSEISKSMLDTLEYSNVILISFSILSMIISLILLGTIVMLNVIESKDEIKLFKYLGISKRDTNSMFIVQSLLQGFIAFIISSIELFVINIFLSKSIGAMLGINIASSFNFLVILVVFVVSIVLPLLTSSITLKVLTRKKYEV